MEYIIRVRPTTFIARGDDERDALQDVLNQMLKRHELYIMNYKETKKRDTHLG